MAYTQVRDTAQTSAARDARALKEWKRNNVVGYSDDSTHRDTSFNWSKGGVATLFVSATTVDATHIDVTFDNNVQGTGVFSADNGSDINVSAAVIQANKSVVRLTVDTMANGETIIASYASGLTAVTDGIAVTVFTDESVTNTL